MIGPAEKRLIVACRQDHYESAFTHTLTESEGADPDCCKTKLARKFLHNLQFEVLRARGACDNVCSTEQISVNGAAN